VQKTPEMEHSDFDRRESGTQTHHDKYNVMKVDKEVTCKTTDLKPPLKQRTFVPYLISLITLFGFCFCFFMFFGFFLGLNSDITCFQSYVYPLWLVFHIPVVIYVEHVQILYYGEDSAMKVI
jgi:hypothetical protein